MRKLCVLAACPETSAVRSATVVTLARKTCLRGIRQTRSAPCELVRERSIVHSCALRTWTADARFPSAPLFGVASLVPDRGSSMGWSCLRACPVAEARAFASTFWAPGFAHTPQDIRAQACRPRANTARLPSWSPSPRASDSQAPQWNKSG